MCSVVVASNPQFHPINANNHISSTRVRRVSLPDIHALHMRPPIESNACQCQPFGAHGTNGLVVPSKGRQVEKVDVVPHPQKRRGSAPQLYTPSFLREAPILPQAKSDPHPKCNICNMSLLNVVTCTNPDWPSCDLCEPCFDSLPRCVSCERRNTVGRKICVSSNICVDCVYLDPVFTTDDAEFCLQRALEFYETHLNLTFTDEQLKYQFMSDDRYVQILEEEKKKTRQRRASVTADTKMTVVAQPNGYFRREARPNTTQRNQMQYKTANNNFENQLYTVVRDTRSGSCNNFQDFQTPHTCASRAARSLGKNFIKPVPMSLMNSDPSQPRNGAQMQSAKYGKCESCKLKVGGIEKRFVNKIEVVKGLPQVLFTAHLCHELMHAYIHLNNFPKPAMKTEEGFCNAISYLYLQNELLSYSLNPKLMCNTPQPPYARELLEFYLRKFEKNTNEIYGDGFRQAKTAINRHGLPSILEALKTTSTFPMV